MPENLISTSPKAMITMKLLHRIGVLFLLISICTIIYIVRTPEKYNELNAWYNHHRGGINTVSNQGPRSSKFAETKHLAESKRLHDDFKDIVAAKKIISKHIKSKNNKDNKQEVANHDKPKLETKSKSNMIKLEDDNYEATRIKKLLDAEKENKITTKSKIILIYTGLHKSEEWYNLPKDKLNGYLKRTRCKYKNCRVTYDKFLLPIADAVIFHERNMPSADALELLNRYDRPESQRWVFFTSETPKNSDYGIIPYNGFFNWTMTYKTDSDIFLPYLQYRKLKKTDKRPDSNINYAKGKSHAVAWLVGNCDFEFRMEVAHALEQSIDVHVGGGCRDEFEKKMDCTRWCNITSIKDYKFYLAFENGICNDYITEKYWFYVEKDIVPVVLGGANYSDPRLAIPGSFIDASKFKSIKDLAAYLEFLDKDDVAYNKYFEWKQKYKVWHPKHGDWPFESYFLCKICKMLQQDLPKKIYHKLSDFWDENADCQIPEDQMRKKIVPEGYNWEARQRFEDMKARKDKAKVPVDFDEDFR